MKYKNAVLLMIFSSVLLGACSKLEDPLSKTFDKDSGPIVNSPGDVVKELNYTFKNTKIINNHKSLDNNDKTLEISFNLKADFNDRIVLSSSTNSLLELLSNNDNQLNEQNKNRYEQLSKSFKNLKEVEILKPLSNYDKSYILILNNDKSYSVYTVFKDKVYDNYFIQLSNEYEFMNSLYLINENDENIFNGLFIK